jgi:hypothetical protein
MSSKARDLIFGPFFPETGPANFLLFSYGVGCDGSFSLTQFVIDATESCITAAGSRLDGSRQSTYEKGASEREQM